MVADALPRDRPVAVVDLGAGTGSNARYLSPFLRTAQDWLLVDHDPSLLALARERLSDRVETRVADLSDIAGHAALIANRSLVTASALLDLVSEAWLRSLLTACAAARTPVLFALSYDGRIVCEPEEPDDRWVCELVNRHQRTDKGFGPALGPDAARFAAGLLRQLGYEVVSERSDWTPGPGAADFQRELIDGWAAAAAEIAPDDSRRIEGWQARRLAAVVSGQSRLVVGHEDVAGLPT
jgi:hypothetical protein